MQNRMERVESRLRESDTLHKQHGKVFHDNHVAIKSLQNMTQYLNDAAAIEEKQIARFSEVEKMFVQIDTAFCNIRDSILTSDTYVNDYLPFKVLKMTSKLHLDVLSTFSPALHGGGDSQA